MRETYVMRDGKLVPKSQAEPLRCASFNVLPDIAPFTTQDGTAITSRSHLRDYEQKNGVKQIGNDFATLHRQLRERVRGDSYD